MKPLTRAELLDLPPVTTLPMLARAFGISEPVARERQRQGEFEALGIRILRFGYQWRVITADVLAVLGVEPASVGGNRAQLAAVGTRGRPPGREARAR